MSSVDDRIVNMQFNNKQFIQGASETQRSLDGVERAIGKAGGSKGFTTMGSAVQGIQSKFSAMQVVGVTALATITNKAVNAGINLVKSLTLDPIMDGFSEYQTNLNSIQTVMANTGAGVDEVNGYMNKLNAYSDQTIYNFSEMAKNIGTFTAAGVDLKTSTAAIQGISNIAALSGSSSQQASTAMYQLSQSIASGKVGLQDWNSVVNAGMGGKNFQTALATTAAAMGDISQSSLEVGDKVKVAGKSFRESIQGGDSWLTSDTLVKTLELMDGRLSSASYEASGLSKAEADLAVSQQKAKLATEGYSKAQIESLTTMANSAYESATVVKTFPQLMQVVKESIGSVFAQSFSTILGNFEQSKALWTKVGSYLIGPTGFISKAGNAWGGMLTRWANDGGRDKVIRSFGRIFSTLGKVMGAFGDAFQEVFPPDSKLILMQITRLFTHFTKNLVIGEDTVESLKNIFGGFFAILHIGMTIFKAVASAAMAFFGAIIGPSKGAGGGILSIVGSLGKVLMAFDKFLTRGDSINKVFSAIGGTVGSIISPILSAIAIVGKAFGSLATGGGVGGFLNTLGEAKGSVADFVSKLLGGLSQVTAPFQAVSGVVSSLKAKVDSVRDSFSSASAPVSEVASTIDDLKTKALPAQKTMMMVAGSLEGVKDATDAVKGGLKDMSEGFTGGSKSAQDSTGRLAASADDLKGRWSSVSGVMSSLGNAIHAIFQKIGDVANGVKDAFQQLFGGMDALDWASVLNSLFTGALLLNISSFVKSTNGLFTGLANSLFGTSKAIQGSFGQLTSTLKTMQTQVKSQIVKNIAIAVALIAASIIALSFIKPEKIGVATTAIAVMMGILIGTFKALDKLQGDKELALISIGITLISAAMINLAAAIAILGNLDIKTLEKGIGAMAAILGLLIGTMFLFSKIQGSMEGMAASMLVISFAMNIMAGAIFTLGSMKGETLKKGLGAMGAGLAILAGSMLILDRMKGSPAGLAGSILILAGAMVVMTKAVGTLGKMKMGTLMKGIGAMAVILLLMVSSISILAAGGPEAMMGAAALVLLAIAMNMMLSVILALGAAPWKVVYKGILALGVALAVILAAGALAMIVAPGLLALGAAVGLLGLALALAGAGMFLFATGFAIFAAAGVAGVALIGIAFSTLMALLPAFAVQVGAAIVTFVETIAKMSPRLRTAFVEIFNNILGTIEDAIPAIESLLEELVDSAIDVIEHTVPRWVEAGFMIIDEFMKSAAKHVPDIATSAGDLIVEFIKSLDNSLQDIIDAGTDLLVNFLAGIGNSYEKIVNAVGDLILDMLNAIDNAIVFYGPQIEDAGFRIAGHIMDGMKSALGRGVGSIIGAAIPGGKVKNPPAQGGGGTVPPSNRNAVPKTQKSKAATTSWFGAASADVALRLANAMISEKDPGVLSALGKAQNQQKLAAAAQARADAAAADVAALDKKYNKGKKNATKKQQDKIDKAQRIADNKSNQAQAAADRASDASSGVDSAISFRDADAAGRGDLRRDQAAAAADVANQKFARAQELQRLAAAAKSAGDTKKATALERKATLALTDARNAATSAENLATEATSWYAISVNNRIADIEKGYQEDLAARAAEKAYNEADDAGKLAILNQRKADDQAAADAAQAEYNRQIASAKQLATTDAAAANVALDQAEKQAELVARYLDAVSSDAQSIEQLTGSLSQNGSSGGSLSPSRTAMEDAAKAVDRYTESLAVATELAGAPQGPVQFIQNNTSPVALSPIDTYRLGKNLISGYEIKMGVNN